MNDAKSPFARLLAASREGKGVLLSSAEVRELLRLRAVADKARADLGQGDPLN